MVTPYTKESFENKMFHEPNTGCWLSFGKSEYGPTKKSYELFKGPIPKGQWILHSCDTPSCCNPRHLTLGDRSQNMKEMYERNRLGNNTVARYRANTHCPHGHPYSGKNLLWDKNRDGRPYRKCRTCKNNRK